MQNEKLRRLLHEAGQFQKFQCKERFTEGAIAYDDTRCITR